ncbi:MAG: nucleotide exchange factor GrpE [Myxococcota bacterium]
MSGVDKPTNGEDAEIGEKTKPIESPPEHDLLAEEDELDRTEELTPDKQRLRELEGQLSEAQARLRTVSKKYTELEADKKAFRERMEARAKVDAEQRRFTMAKAFFDPVMNLERSMDNAPVGDFGEGIKIVHQQFLDALNKLGLEEVPGVGAAFDPKVHEALGITPVTDPEQDGKVLIVHQKGFVVDGKVLQAAQVVIGKLQAPAGDA